MAIITVDPTAMKLERFNQPESDSKKTFFVRATGRFYTPEPVVERLILELSQHLLIKKRPALRIVDPFCGDGRLVLALLHALGADGVASRVRFDVALWDSDGRAVRRARAAVSKLATTLGIDVEVHGSTRDSFAISPAGFDAFDCVVTNPPWENLKPDKRELSHLSPADARDYQAYLRTYDRQLAGRFPASQPLRKFSGWGTNLSRCGVELATRLVAADGLIACVAPYSLLSDQTSTPLRRWLFLNCTWLNIDFYPAEARLFDQVDTPFVTFVSRKSPSDRFEPTLVSYSASLAVKERSQVALLTSDLEQDGYIVPVELGQSGLSLVKRWHGFPTIRDLHEPASGGGLRTGRELDETNRASFLVAEGKVPFVKGRMVTRFGTVQNGLEFLKEGARRIPKSASHPRVVWRDVSRRSQARRLHATILPAGPVTGNSLHVAYFTDDDPTRLKALLGVMNSLCFEAQIRAKLGTGHVSLGVVKTAHVPDIASKAVASVIADHVEAIQNGDCEKEALLELTVARAYGLDKAEFKELVRLFPRIDEEYRDTLADDWLWEVAGQSLTVEKEHNAEGTQTSLSHHYSATLSAVDLEMARNVRPGENWKSIPTTIPSKRLAQIRKSYAAGEGSRSTYYGRLKPDAPAYTINTYFTRPGNGCHLHYDYDGGQHRVISEREAARLQSFPDLFRFIGSHTSIAKQIGNAVPPLLAYQIAKAMPRKGQLVDVFCGAGGLSLGFTWAGWSPVAANDIDPVFLKTYTTNVHSDIVSGSIRDATVFDALVQKVRSSRRTSQPLLVLGGPPCQGFSTAGKRRSMEDDRNTLFYRYRDLLKALKPAAFVFENVTGLLNMEGGRVFDLVRRELSIPGMTVTAWILKAENYGVPQRRTRVFIVGTTDGLLQKPPAPVTEFRRKSSNPFLFDGLAPAVTVSDAIGDLPAIHPSQDGSSMGYRTDPGTSYQELMRGVISPDDFLASITLNVSSEAVLSGRR